MGEEQYTNEDAARAERRGWVLVNQADPDAMHDMGFLDAIAYIDSLSPAEIGCVVTALLGARGALRYPPSLRRAVANALMCWNAGDRDED